MQKLIYCVGLFDIVYSGYPDRYMPHASAGRDPFGSYIATVVSIHSPVSIAAIYV